MGKDYGILKDEVVEIVIYLVFYVGWFKVWLVMVLIKEVYGE